MNDHKLGYPASASPWFAAEHGPHRPYPLGIPTRVWRELSKRGAGYVINLPWMTVVGTDKMTPGDTKVLYLRSHLVDPKIANADAHAIRSERLARGVD